MSSNTPGAGSAEPQMDWDAVARYLAGESPTAERDSVQRWLASAPANAKLISALDDALDGLTLGPAATAGIDVEAALATVKTRLASEPADPNRVVAFPRRRAPSRSWIPIAIAAALVLAAGTLVVRSNGSREPGPTIAARDFTTPVGGRDSLVLPDGSQVILGPGSRLTIGAGYGLADRMVVVRGEVYFNVKHDAARPFVVEANAATIRDIGTAFVVHTDSTGGVRVAVTSGTVELNRTASSTKSGTLLHAGDVGTMALDGTVAAAPGTESDDDLAWTHGKLIFRDATLAEVRDDLRRWYGIELAVSDTALLRRTVHATFDGDSVGQVLKVIGLDIGVRIERRGDTAWVRATPETPRPK